jgi:phenylalanine-4-hydroxylase
MIRLTGAITHFSRRIIRNEGLFKPLQPRYFSSGRVAILTELSDNPGSLHEVLRYFWKYDINLTRIESRPSPDGHKGFHLYIDFDGRQGDTNTDNLITALKANTKNILVLDEKEVPWFPTHVSELDIIANNTLDAGQDLEADHPGFSDPEYRKRRAELAEVALQHRFGAAVPHIEYSAAEKGVWGLVWDKLIKGLQPKYACSEYLRAFAQLQQHVGYSREEIPQVEDISRYLQRATGFRLRPVAGLHSSRDFLNGLAFRTFFRSVISFLCPPLFCTLPPAPRPILI